jgi:transposase
MRYSFSFPKDVIEAIARERYEHVDPRVQERMEILWLKSKQESHERIAELANVSRSTVQRILRIYVVKGLAGIRSFGWKGQASALTPHQQTIEAEFRERPPHTAHEAARRIEAMTGVKRQASRVRKFMKEALGMKCLKVAPVPVPPKKTVEEHAQTQAAFLKSGA